MFCAKCGKKFEDGAMFCAGCGAPSPTNASGCASAVKKPFPVKIVVILAAVVLAIILLITLVGGSGNPEDVIKEYFEALYSHDYETAFEIKCDPYAIENSGRSEEDLKEDVINDLEQGVYYAEGLYGENLRITEFKVDRIKEYDSDDVEKISEHMSFRYGYPEGAIDEVYLITYEMTIEGDRHERPSIPNDVVVSKIDGDWYMSVGDYNTEYALENILD